MNDKNAEYTVPGKMKNMFECIDYLCQELEINSEAVSIFAICC